MKYLLFLGSVRSLGLGLGLSIACPALAEDYALPASPADAETEITVLATGLRQPLDATGQAIAVIGTAEIDAIQGPDITRVLERLPGVSITRNGGLGGFTGVRIRGAESEQTLVLVDGARVADVSSPGSGFDFGSVLSGNIAKVEILRGSNSVVWGSDAIGGVIALTTRAVEGVEASAEYGAYDSFTGSAAAGLKSGGLALSVNGGYARSDGFSRLAADAEKDGFEQWQGGARASYDFGNGLSAFADARYARSVAGLDFSFANDYTQLTRQISGRTGVAYTGEALDLTAAYSLADTHRAYDSPFFGYEYNGQDQRVDLNGRYRFAPGLALVFGASHDWTRYDGTFDSRQQAKQASGHALLDYTAGRLNVAAGVRLDHHDRFGDAWTLGANGSVEVVSGWRVRASYGEGFKAPTLYQLYGFAGNAALRPERSRSYEAGIDHGTRDGPLHFGATVFRRESRDLIDYDAATFGYFNVSRARATGVELEADARPSDSLQLHAVYTYVKSVNRLTGNDLARRPRNSLTLAADWTTPLAGLVLGGDVRLVSDSFDDVGSTVRLDGYAVTGLRASLPIAGRFEVFGRVENVADVKYQTVAGYNTPGRSAYAGLRARF